MDLRDTISGINNSLSSTRIFAHPVFYLDTFINKEDPERILSYFSRDIDSIYFGYLKNLISDIAVYKVSLAETQILDILKEVIFKSIVDSFEINIGGLLGSLTNNIIENISQKTSQLAKNLSKPTVKALIGLQKSNKGLPIDNFHISFSLGVGAQQVRYTIRHNSSNVRLGALHFVRFNWGVEEYEITFNTIFSLYPAAKSVLNVFGDLLKPYAATLRKVYSGTGYPNYASIGNIYSRIIEDIFRLFSNHSYFLFFQDRLYYGWLNSFSFLQDSSDPLKRNITVTFIAHPASGWVIWDNEAIRQGLSIISASKPNITSQDFTNAMTYKDKLSRDAFIAKVLGLSDVVNTIK